MLHHGENTAGGIVRLGLAALALAGVASNIVQAAPAKPARTNNWPIVCGKAPRARCVATQSVSTDPTGRNIILAAAVMLGKPGEPAQFHLRVAKGIDRKIGFGLKFEDGTVLQLGVADCNANTCDASGRLTPDVRARFTRSRGAQVAWRLASGRAMLVPLDLRGMGAALSALESRSQTLNRKLSTSPSTTT